MPIPDIIPIKMMMDLHTPNIGQCTDGKQFFVARHYVSSSNEVEDRHYLALYRFDKNGVFTDSDIRQLTDSDDEQAVLSLLLHSLGDHDHRDILIAPFQIDYDGLSFGLIPDDQKKALTLEPGSIITFMEPWDGEYYT